MDKNQKRKFCDEYGLIFLENGTPHIITLGEYQPLEIKQLLAIPESHTLYKIVGHDKPKEIKDDEVIKIRGCEIFYGNPPSGTASSDNFEKVFGESEFSSALISSPKFLKEAGATQILFKDVIVDAGKKVDVLLEWPSPNRILFSEKIATPKDPNSNWPPNYQVYYDGRMWFGASVRTAEKTPYKTFLSYMRALVW